MRGLYTFRPFSPTADIDRSAARSSIMGFVDTSIFMHNDLRRDPKTLAHKAHKDQSENHTRKRVDCYSGILLLWAALCSNSTTSVCCGFVAGF